MASKEDNEARASQTKNLMERIALSDGYAAMLGQQSIQSFNAFTFEEALDAQIERIEGKGTDRRPNALVRVDRIEGSLLQAISVLKNTAPEEFIEPSDDQDVNTAKE